MACTQPWTGLGGLVSLNPEVAVIALVALLSGCTTRSISDSGYDAGSGRYGRSNALYQGELSDFDVLGLDRGAQPTDAEIVAALDHRRQFALPRGSKVLLIQSGASIPDDAMTLALGTHFDVGVFTGVPVRAAYSASERVDRGSEHYARSLRLAAARGGHEKIIVYWGALESSRENLLTSAISWVPVVGWALPDERQRMRIRLKLALIDVRTGAWEMFMPTPFEDRGFSSIVSRRETDQSLVLALKNKAYVAAATDLTQRYATRKANAD